MFKSFLSQLFVAKTTSWASQPDFIEKVLETPYYNETTRSGHTIGYKVWCALKFLILISFLCFSMISVLTEKNPQLRFDSIYSFSGAIHLVVNVMQVLMKFLILWLLKEKREKLSKYVIDFTSSLEASNNENFKEISRKYGMYSRRIVATSFVVYIVGLLAYNILPLFSSDEWKLPVQAPIYGISYRGHPGYEMSYVLIVLQFLIIAPIAFAFDSFFYLYCLFTVLIFEFCKISCVSIGDMTSKYDTEEKQREFVQFVGKMHSDALEFLRDFKECFEIAVLMSVSTFMGIICFAIVQIASDNQLSAYFGLLVVTLQLLLYSSFGQMIITKQEEFVDAIYCSYWYELKTISTRKMVYLILMNAQKCEGIKLVGFMDLSLEAFSEMVKACYSFIIFVMNFM